ncbi:MAG: SDR family oxidoreductase [Desulfobacterales bacterium]|nr:SDR family oxidoreductase [Desulfobacterales bacterium]
MKTYFITGATGAIGCAIVPLLLKNDDCQVRLLMRAKNHQDLENRLAKLMTFWGYVSNQNKILCRIKAIPGDITLPRFGTNQKEYEGLSYECTHIIHSAGNVRMNLPLEEARKCSVDSAHNIMGFAEACRQRGNLKKVEFVSTVGVGGRNPGLIPETWITNKRGFHNTYEEAKAESEIFIAQQIKNEMPVTVHRPSMVVGDSKTGRIIHFQIFYHLCEFLSGSRTLGITPDVQNTLLDIIPSDYVARAIAWSCNQDATVGHILHLCSGPDKAIEINDLKTKIQDIFKSYGKKLPKTISVPINLFRVSLPIIRLFISPRAKRALKALPIFFEYLAEHQSFANQSTQALLSPEGIVVPPIRDYLEIILTYYLRHTHGLF